MTVPNLLNQINSASSDEPSNLKELVESGSYVNEPTDPAEIFPPETDHDPDDEDDDEE